MVLQECVFCGIPFSRPLPSAGFTVCCCCYLFMTLCWFLISFFLASDRFYDDIEEMIGYPITPFFHVAWKYLTPAVSGGLFTFYVLTHKSIKFNDSYEYPAWAIVLGWSLAMVSIIMLPLTIILAWFTAPKGLTYVEVIFCYLFKLNWLIIQFCIVFAKKLQYLYTNLIFSSF